MLRQTPAAAGGGCDFVATMIATTAPFVGHHKQASQAATTSQSSEHKNFLFKIFFLN
jgi:hypothetical protein